MLTTFGWAAAVVVVSVVDVVSVVSVAVALEPSLEPQPARAVTASRHAQASTSFFTFPPSSGAASAALVTGDEGVREGRGRRERDDRATRAPPRGSRRPEDRSGGERPVAGRAVPRRHRAASVRGPRPREPSGSATGLRRRRRAT